MKALCGSCTLYDYECPRTPGYYRSPVEEACKFYAKKVKKMAKKETKKNPKEPVQKLTKKNRKLKLIQPDGNIFCGDCRELIGRVIDGKHWFMEGDKDPLCEKCYKYRIALTQKKPEPPKETKETKDTEEKKDTGEYFLVIRAHISCFGVPGISTYVFKTLKEALEFINVYPNRTVGYHICKVTSSSAIFENVWLREQTYVERTDKIEVRRG